MTPDQLLDWADQLQAENPDAATLLRERAALKSGVDLDQLMAGRPQVEPEPRPEPEPPALRSTSTPVTQAAYRTYVEDDRPSAVGRVPEWSTTRMGHLSAEQKSGLDRLRVSVTRRALAGGESVDEAERLADEAVQKVRDQIYGTDRQPTTSGERGFVEQIPKSMALIPSAGLAQGAAALGLLARNIPLHRTTRISEHVELDEEGYTQKVKRYRDPDTGELTEPTEGQLLRESMARQEVLTPADVEAIKAQRAEERRSLAELREQLWQYRNPDVEMTEENRLEILESIAREDHSWVEWAFTTEDPSLGRVVESPTAAAIRVIPAMVSTVVNEAVMGYLPLFWEQDPDTGAPVHGEDDPAYRIYSWIREQYEDEGLSEEEIDDLLHGGLMAGAPGVDGFDLPMPFQPIQRAMPTPMDPTGQRVANVSGDFLARLATAMAAGRTMPDEMMSIPGYREASKEDFYAAHPEYNRVLKGDDTWYEYLNVTSPYWIGMGMEMVYGLGPLSIARRLAGGATTALKASARAARAAGLPGADPAVRAATAVGDPIEWANRAVTERLASDVAGRPISEVATFEDMLDRNSVRRVAGEVVSSETTTPYVVAAVARSSKPGSTVTAGQLRQAASGSKAATALLDAANVSQNLNRAVPPSVLLDLQERTARWQASAQRVQADVVMKAGPDPDVAARQLMGLLRNVGVDPNMLPEWAALSELARGGKSKAAASSLQKAYDSIWGPAARSAPQAMAIQPGRRVVLAAHDLGSQILSSAGAPGVRLTGVLARGFGKHLGDEMLTPHLIVTQPGRVATAARAAAGRLVEATLENEVPDDLVFVTQGLMAPRRILTQEGYDRVSATMRGYDFQPGDGTLGSKYVVGDPRRARQDWRASVGAENIAASPARRGLDEALEKGEPLSAAQQMMLVEDLMTAAWEEVLGESAKASVLSGQQADRARRAGVGVGILPTGPEARVPMRSIGAKVEDAQRLMREIGIRTPMVIKKMIDRAARNVGATPPTAAEVKSWGRIEPAALGRALDEAQDRIGAVQEQLYKEVRSQALADGDPVKGFNLVIKRRVDREIARQWGLLEEQVEVLMRRGEDIQTPSGWSPKLGKPKLGLKAGHAWWLAGYRYVGDIPDVSRRQSGLGQSRRAVRSIKPAKIKAEIRRRVEEEVRGAAWWNLLESFYGSTVVEKLTYDRVANLNALAKTGATSTPTIQGFKDAIEELRLGDAALRERGASPGIIAPVLRGVDLQVVKLESPAKDAIAQTLIEWLVRQDKQAIAYDVARRVKHEHPEVYVDLLPSFERPVGAQQFRAFAARTGRGVESAGTRVWQESHLPQTTRRGVFDKLLSMTVDPKLPKKQRDAALEKRVQAWSSQVFKGFDELFQPDWKAPLGDAGTVKMKSRARYGTLAVKTDAGSVRSPAAALSEMATKRILSFGARERGEAALTVVAKMLENKTSYVMTEEVAAQVLKEQGLSASRKYKTDWSFAHINSLLSDLMRAPDLHRSAWQQGQRAWSPADVTTRSYTDSYGWTPTANEADNAWKAFGNEADYQLWLLVKGALAQGHRLDDVSKAIHDTALVKAYQALVDPIVREISANARALGFQPGGGEGWLQNIPGIVRSIDPLDPSLQVFGSEFREGLNALQQAAISGQLTDTLEQLRKRDRMAAAATQESMPASMTRAQVAWEIATDIFSATRRGAAGGMLASGMYLGTPVPLPSMATRYMGVNVITHPLIAATGVGVQNAIRSMTGPGWRAMGEDLRAQLRNTLRMKPIDAVRERPLDELVFERNGVPWTWGQLKASMEQRNIWQSQGSVEFQQAWGREVEREAHLTAEGLPTGPMRDFFRRMNIAQTGYAQYIANAFDRAFRQNMYAHALASGMPEGQAAQLARGVALDYGEELWGPLSGFRDWLNRYALFVSFRASMMSSLMQSLARDADTFNRQWLAVRDAQQSSDAYLYGEDYNRARIILDPRQRVRDDFAVSMVYGPSHPSVEALLDAIQFGSFVMQLGAPDQGFEMLKQRLADEVEEENLIPLLSLGMRHLFGRYSKRKDSEPGHRVPEVWVAAAVMLDKERFWPWLRREFNIVPTPREGWQPGRMEVDGEQFKFQTWGDQRRFEAWITVLEYVGSKRHTSDATKLRLSAGLYPEGLYPGRYADPSPPGFASGMETSISKPEPEPIWQQAVKRQTGVARDLTPREPR